MAKGSNKTLLIVGGLAAAAAVVFVVTRKPTTTTATTTTPVITPPTTTGVSGGSILTALLGNSTATNTAGSFLNSLFKNIFGSGSGAASTAGGGNYDINTPSNPLTPPGAFDYPGMSDTGGDILA